MACGHIYGHHLQVWRRLEKIQADENSEILGAFIFGNSQMLIHASNLYCLPIDLQPRRSRLQGHTCAPTPYSPLKEYLQNSCHLKQVFGFSFLHEINGSFRDLHAKYSFSCKISKMLKVLVSNSALC